MQLSDLKLDNTRLYTDWYTFKENYEIRKDGVIRRHYKNGKTNIISIYKTAEGYLQVGIFINGTRKLYQHHRIVAEVFIPNPENKPFVNHKNGIKDDNNIENLEWVTHKENMRHARQTGLIKPKKIVVLESLKDLRYDKSSFCMVSHFGKKYPIKKQRGRFYIQHSKGQLTVTSVMKEDLFSDLETIEGWQRLEDKNILKKVN